MAGGENAQPDMTTFINQFNQTMTNSQNQIQHLQEVIQQLAEGANIQNQSNEQIVIDMNDIRNQLQKQLSDSHAEDFPPPPIQPPHYSSPPLDLQLPTPTPFSGDPSELRSFQLRLCEFFSGSPARFHDDYSRLLYSGSSLTGAARKWYEGLMDPSTNRLPPTYTFDSFLLEMLNFFGGGVNTLTLERDLDNLRQTGSVSDYAIKFQNITNCFHPRWPDHPLIFQFSLRLNSLVRTELIGRGSPPLTFQAYVAAAVLVELNQADARSSRGGSHLLGATK